MTDQTPAYWVVIYTSDHWDGPLISSAEWAKTPEEASHRVVNREQGRNPLNVAGPFTNQVEAESYRRTWARSALATETASGPVPTDSNGNVWGSWADADAASEASAPVGSVAPVAAVKSDQDDTDTKLYVPILENMPADPAEAEEIETGPAQ